MTQTRTPAENTLPTLLYYDVTIVLTVDASDGTQTTLRDQYQRAHLIIEDVLSGQLPVRVRAADAQGRGDPVPGSDEERWLWVHDLTPTELERFLHGYEKIHADAKAAGSPHPPVAP